MAKLGFFKSLIAGVFLGFFFYETSIGNFIVSLIATNLLSLGEYSAIIIPIVIVTLACILIDNKISGVLVGLILGILIFDFPFYIEQSTSIAANLLQGDIQATINSINVVLNQLRSNISNFPFIITIVTSASIGFSMGKHLGKKE
ncbi:MAG: hypothetical protein J7L47_09860 [Candidatus Odinarchaeota archaeon]|nr:hypothetical protein [Candidatus Odinarchaeota archaeon]